MAKLFMVSKRHIQKIKKEHGILLALALFGVIATALLLITKAAEPNVAIEAENVAVTAPAELASNDPSASGTGNNYILFKEEVTNPPSGVRCVLSLHGRGGSGAAFDFGEFENRDPNGNLFDGGGYAWRYDSSSVWEGADPDGTGYISGKQIITDNIEGCGQVIIHGFSNGGGYAAALWCRSESFGGRVIGYIIDDPELNGMTDNCQRPTTIKAIVYWTGALEGWLGMFPSQIESGVGFPVTPSIHSGHSAYSNPPEVSSWWR